MGTPLVVEIVNADWRLQIRRISGEIMRWRDRGTEGIVAIIIESPA
jgi:hypothetical protein